MRITSGQLKNRRIDVPNIEGVRPTKESVREAIFSSIGGHCTGWHVIDLFAGAGGLGLEAWSRGAESVTFVEQHAQVVKKLQANIAELQCDELGTVRCIRDDVFRWLARSKGEGADLILADPPYDLPDALERTLNGIAENGVLAEDGLLVYELRAKYEQLEIPVQWELVKEKRYGQTRVLMLTLKERLTDE